MADGGGAPRAKGTQFAAPPTVACLPPRACVALILAKLARMTSKPCPKPKMQFNILEAKNQL
jgi:hypothetical protein